jgi:hypothetical protein
MIGFFAYLAVHTGWRSAWFRAQRHGWHDSMSVVGAPVRHVETLWRGDLIGLRSGQLNPLVGVAGLVLVGVGGWLLVRWRPPAPLIAYAFVSISLALASQRVGARPRMLLAAFPLVVALGVRCTGRTYRLVLGASVLASVAAAVLIFGSLAMTP